MKTASKALEVNLADYHVEVSIDPHFTVLQQIMSRYYGIMEGVNVFLEELSHPYRNWEFIVQQARGYSLDYFHLLRDHPDGPQGAIRFVDIFTRALAAEVDVAIKIEAVDNLLLFLQKIIKDAGRHLDAFRPVLEETFGRILASDDKTFFLFVKSYYKINQLAKSLLTSAPDPGTAFPTLAKLLCAYYRHTYSYWCREIDPLEWFQNEMGSHSLSERYAQPFGLISHTQISVWQAELEALTTSVDPTSGRDLQRLCDLPGYHQIVDRYRQIPQQLFAAAPDKARGHRVKVIFLFHMMNLKGLSMIHEEVMRDIDRTVSHLMGSESHDQILELIHKTFSILKAQTLHYPATALNCVLTMGKGVFKTDESDLINDFIEAVIDLGFQAPEITGVGNDWQIKVNSNHLLNVRTWLEVIELKPQWSTRLLSYLTIHLALCGVFIKDTDLFPRDITRLLNSEIEPVYNLVKQLARLFPAFFNDIGAEGRLRDISTRLDEITHREDALVHFLRKQSHVESSNLIIGFMQATLKFWQTRQKALLEPYVPPITYGRIDPTGPHVEGLHRVMVHLADQGIDLPQGLLDLKGDRVEQLLQAVPDVSTLDRERADLAISLYRLLHQKYNLEFIDIHPYLAQLRAAAFPELGRLQQALEETDEKTKVGRLLDYLELLRTLILSPQTYEAREDIYRKRHFTVDIPSMYGSYHELKFDALGLTFRIEALLNVLFENLINRIDLSLITKATFYQIYNLLQLFERALKLDGIRSLEIERQMEFLSHSLEVKGFTFTQYLDIFKGFAQAVKNIVNDFFNNIHEENLTRIISQVPNGQILSKYLPRTAMADAEKLQHRVSEIFFRERIAVSLGLQTLDLFLSRILNTLFHQAEKLPPDRLQLLLNYDPKRVMTSITTTNSLAAGIIYLGNKGFNMVKLMNFGLPVPPGFIITTEAFRCREIIDNYGPAEANFNEQVAGQIAALEKLTAKEFGNCKNPLLFSVRSGSSISQPGMMDTFLDVGINEEIAQGLAARSRNPWFAWDCYRRYLQGFGMSHGLERDDFDAIISHSKKKFGIPLKKELTGQQMKAVALTYKELIQDAGHQVPREPIEQLLAAIKSVFTSWHSAKAQTYRRIMGISDDWGTAVTVQAMVFGNLSQQSGSGVFFTHNPRWSGGSLRLWGDFTLGNQGEDVVSGLVNTLPISAIQRDTEGRPTEVTLETHFPDIYKTLKAWANELIYTKGWSPQEIEFTFEGASARHLFMLQTRDMSMRERKQVDTFDLEEMPSDRRLGHGVGVSGGAMSGRLVFSLEEIDHWRQQERDTDLILVRADTVPDDIREIFAADGLLTARGGLTSHAAVVAHRLGKTCVVGCGNLICNEPKRRCHFESLTLVSGDPISIDGQEGSVLRGSLKIKKG